ncbi:MAG: MotA/TolQ/ExbB proton channel family protein [Rhodobacteraceae bacterium]|nr:MAG: MotA/TolQ/ExbB proton channel family protein [Paracoccaceae bacterium]
MTEALEAVEGFLALGGPVVAILLAMSMLALALVLVKFLQFQRAGVGNHVALVAALNQADQGATEAALRHAEMSRTHLAPLAMLALGVEGSSEAARARLTGLAEEALARLQAGFRLLDSIAQIAPLLGLFGTVLGMIAAFQALQEAGQNVDPAELAGGIWVALLTTAMGLGVAMPTALALTWLESRVAREARLAMQIIDVALCRGLAQSAGRADG